MYELQGAELALASNKISNLGQAIRDQMNVDASFQRAFLADGDTAHLSTGLNELLEVASSINAEVTAASIRQVMESMHKYTFEAFRGALYGLEMAFYAELRTRLLLFIDPSRNEYYEDPQSFFESFLKAFPKCLAEVEEACKCYALDRGTACVFHLMRIMEHSSDAVVSSLAPPVPKEGGVPGWGRNMRILNLYLENKNKEPRPSDWKQRIPFYESIRADWTAMYKGWRCDTVHDLTMYDPSKAKWIMDAVIQSLNHIATHVDQAGSYS